MLRRYFLIFSISLFYLLHLTKAVAAESQLPVIKIETDGASIADEPRIVAEMAVFEHGSDVSPTISSHITIETRGNTAQYFPKKCYGFETVTDEGKNNNISLLGLPKENDWVLYASFSDKTFVRDGLSYSIFRQMGYYAPRARHCIVYINDEYQGIYILTEKIKIDSQRVNSCKSGALLELTDIVRVKSDEIYFNSTLGKRCFVVKNPSQLEDPSVIQAQTLINSFESLIMAKDFANSTLDQLAEVIDLSAMVDFVLLNETIRNVDVMYVSTFWHVARDGKLTIGPLWDCDISLGNANYMEGWKPNGLYAVTRFYAANLYANNEFKILLNKRWAQLRTTILSPSSGIGTIDSLSTVVSAEVAQNYARWNTLGRYVTPNHFIGKTYEEELYYLKSWTLNRFNWLDSAFQCSPYVVSSATRSPRSIAISVTPSAQPYSVSRSSDGKTYTCIGHIDPFDSVFIDTLLRDNALYYYSIADQKTSIPQVVAGWTPLTFPVAPEHLRYSFGRDSSIVLQWDDRSDTETNYVVEVTNLNGTATLDTLPCDTQQYLTSVGQCTQARVFAYNRVGQSQYSNAVSVAISADHVDAFPTVANKNITLAISGLSFQDIPLTIIDGLGRTVYHTAISKEAYSISYSVDVSSFSAGVYSLSVSYNGKMSRFTMVKR